VLGTWSLFRSIRLIRLIRNLNTWLYQKEKYPKDARENAGQTLQERPKFLIWENAAIAASQKNLICCAPTARNTN